MENNGLFRTKMFGGFNKKDVFSYVNSVKKHTADEIEEYKSRVTELACAANDLGDELRETQKELQEEKFKNENSYSKEQYEELQQRVAECEEKLENARQSHIKAKELLLTAKEITAENVRLQQQIEENDSSSVKAAYDQLRNAVLALPSYSRNASNPAQMLSDMASLVAAVDGLKKLAGVGVVVNEDVDTEDEFSFDDFEF